MHVRNIFHCPITDIVIVYTVYAELNSFGRAGSITRVASIRDKLERNQRSAILFCVKCKSLYSARSRFSLDLHFANDDRAQQ